MMLAGNLRRDPSPEMSASGAATRGYTRAEVSRIVEIVADHRAIPFVLADGRELSAPTAWPDRLAHALPADRSSWTICGVGTYVEWPLIDEHIRVWTLLGVPEDATLEAAGFEMELAPAL